MRILFINPGFENDESSTLQPTAHARIYDKKKKRARPVYLQCYYIRMHLFDSYSQRILKKTPRKD